MPIYGIAYKLDFARFMTRISRYIYSLGFYSLIILFFSAEITRQYAIYYNYDIMPKDYAVKIRIQEMDENEGDRLIVMTAM